MVQACTESPVFGRVSPVLHVAQFYGQEPGEPEEARNTDGTGPVHLPSHAFYQRRIRKERQGKTVPEDAERGVHAGFDKVSERADGAGE